MTVPKTGTMLGSKPKVSEVLARKRGLSPAMIRKLHAGLGIPLESLFAQTAKFPAERRPAEAPKGTDTRH